MMQRGRLFFEAEDDGGLGGGGEDGLQFEDAPGRGIALEVVDDEPAEIAGKDRLALLKELQDKEAAFQKEKAALESRVDPVAALQASFAALGERLEKAPRASPTQPAYVPMQPQETAEQFRERIRTTLLEDPVQATAEVAQRLYGPMFQQQAASIAALSKQLLMQQPEKKLIFDRYGQEIEALAATAPGNPNAIFEATEIVASRHMSELVPEQAKALAQTMFEELKAQLGQGAGTRTAAAGVHVETAPVKAPQRDSFGRRVLKVTPTQRAQIATEAKRRNMTEEQYAELYVDTDWQKEFK